jgi:hypothetical protein
MPRPILTAALALTACLGLAGCGADGAPSKPTAKPAIAVSGEVTMGADIK